jgi:hypothetical protein
MKTTEQLREDALGAIRKLFGDTRLSPRETVDELEALKDEIDVMQSSIDVNADKYPGA